MLTKVVNIPKRCVAFPYMNKLLLILSFSFFLTELIAQPDIDADKMIGFACYFGGEPTDPVKRVSKKMEKEDYKAISNLLTSNNPAEQYLAVITLEKLDSLNFYSLEQTELEQIDRIKKSYEQVSYCSGCTFFVTRMLYELFDQQFLSEANIWLDRQLKEKNASQSSRRP